MRSMSWAWAVTRGAAVAAAFLLTGCASEWERAYAPNGVAAATLAETQAVRIRDVPWTRLDAALRELEDQRAASEAPPDEWPADKKSAAKQKLLSALQVTSPAGSVEILGRSAFRTTSSETSPNNGELEAFARRVGATTVVWSANYLGKAQVVRDEPVHEWRSGSYSTGRDGRRSRSYSESSTIWVPVVIEADENAYIAYFLREGAR